MTQKTPARSESEQLIGIVLFGIGTALLVVIFAPPSSGGFGFVVGLLAGLLLAGGLDLIINRNRS